jgi:hypothetical protein
MLSLRLREIPADTSFSCDEVSKSGVGSFREAWSRLRVFRKTGKRTAINGANFMLQEIDAPTVTPERIVFVCSADIRDRAWAVREVELGMNFGKRLPVTRGMRRLSVLFGRGDWLQLQVGS